MNYDRMIDCFETMNDKVAAAIRDTDLPAFFRKLDEVEGPALVCGVGGSSVVASFLAKVLREKRHMICTFAWPRDLKYMDLSGYRSIISVSYSGNNIGVDVMFQTDLKKYLLTGNPRSDCDNIVYSMIREESYVSVSATIVPMSLLLLYYRNDQNILREILNEDISSDSDNSFYEVMSGYETSTASMMLESSLIESGMAACVLHDKYNFCHGRINLSRHSAADLIFFRMDNDLDDVLYDALQSHYRKIIAIPRKFEDDVVNDFYATLMSIRLIREIALNKGKDISAMDELPDNDVFYRFNGDM